MSKKKERNVPITVGLPAEVKEKLEKDAAKDDRPFAQYVRSLIIKHA